MSRSERELYRERLRDWFAMMVGVAKAMPESERRELEEWERANLNGCTIGTSDWPGWEKYIGKPPIPPPLPEPFKKLPIPSELRWQVWERDNFTCVHCGARRDLSVGHLKPESRGGTLDLDNLQTLCRSCNSRKGTRF